MLVLASTRYFLEALNSPNLAYRRAKVRESSTLDFFSRIFIASLFRFIEARTFEAK